MADAPQQAAPAATATTATTATEGQTPLVVVDSLEQQQQQPRGRERMDDNRFCAAEADASYQCLDKNKYDRTKCQDFFTAYRECKKKWVRRRTVEKRAHEHTCSQLTSAALHFGSCQNAERAEARRKLYYG